MTGLSAPRIIIFDWDNTLVDSWHCIHVSLNATLADMGREPWTMEETQKRVALSLRNAFPALFGDRWEQARDIYYGHYSARHMDLLKPLPGAQAMLEKFAGLGIRLAVVSNKTGSFLRAEAKHLGWDRLFDRLVGAHDAPADKPDPAPVRLALEPSGIAPGETVWFAGDAAVDMQCAANSGCVPILLRAQPPDAQEFDRHPPRHYFAAFAGITGLVESLMRPISSSG